MKTPLLHGAGMTLASALIMLALHMLGISTNPDRLLMAMLIAFPCSLLITILGIVLATRAVRTERGPGAFTYGQAFKAGFLTIFFAALTGAVFQFIYYKFLFPDFAEVAIQWTRSLMEKIGAPTGTIEEKLEEMRTKTTAARQVVGNFFWTLVFGSLVSLITSALMKRAAPEDLSATPPLPPRVG